MKNQKNDKRRILLFLPVLILPFLALAFYALGGGTGTDHTHPLAKGINSTLPDASFKRDNPTSKLDIYALTAGDSVKNKERVLSASLSVNTLGIAERTSAIDQRLEAINRQISNPEPQPNIIKNRPLNVEGMDSDVERLEKLMASMQHGGADDGEMIQLSGMLEKVLDIQHPERIRDAYIRTVTDAPDSLFAAIPAFIVSKQTVVQGSTLMVQLRDSVLLNGLNLPKGQKLFGICNLTNQRLMLDIKTIRQGNRIIPVDLTIYGLDGIKGIEAPDAVVGAAVSGGTDDAMRSLQFMTMDQSMGAQAAGAGINAAKSLFSKKVRQIKVRLQAGYPVLLRNNKINKTVHQ